MFKAPRLVYHSTLGLRVITKKEKHATRERVFSGPAMAVGVQGSGGRVSGAVIGVWSLGVRG